jgi:hypothetical protein
MDSELREKKAADRYAGRCGPRLDVAISTAASS